MRKKKKREEETKWSDCRRCWWFYECTRVHAHTHIHMHSRERRRRRRRFLAAANWKVYFCQFSALFIQLYCVRSANMCGCVCVWICMWCHKIWCEAVCWMHSRDAVRAKTAVECMHCVSFGRNTVSALIQQMKGHRKVDFGVRFYLFFVVVVVVFIYFLHRLVVRSFDVCMFFASASLFAIFFCMCVCRLCYDLHFFCNALQAQDTGLMVEIVCRQRELPSIPQMPNNN